MSINFEFNLNCSIKSLTELTVDLFKVNFSISSLIIFIIRRWLIVLSSYFFNSFSSSVFVFEYLMNKAYLRLDRIFIVHFWLIFKLPNSLSFSSFLFSVFIYSTSPDNLLKIFILFICSFHKLYSLSSNFHYFFY